MSDEKKPGLGWFYGRWKRIFERVDKEEIVKSARALTEEFPEEDEEALAARVVMRAARHSAIVGIASAGPTLFSGIGTAVSILGIVPEEIYLMRRQCIMLLTVSVIYGFDPNDDERLYEIVTLVGAPSKSVEALLQAKYDLRRMAVKTAFYLSRETGEKALIKTRAFGRGAWKSLPALGFFVGGAINYYTMRGLGRVAIQFYSELRKKENSDGAKENIAKEIG